jgi:hypothetical protein
MHCAMIKIIFACLNNSTQALQKTNMFLQEEGLGMFIPEKKFYSLHYKTNFMQD